MLIDDLLVIIGTNPGPGKVATTKICARRAGSGLPLVVSIRLDIVAAASEGIQSVMEHELAHALGFGTTWFGANLNDDDDDPRFIGRHAVAAWCLAMASRCQRGVPVEAGDNPGVARAHWRESVLDTELLTPFFDRPWQPLSAITLGVLRDLGHVVDDSKADAFPVTAPSYSPPRVTAGSTLPARVAGIHAARSAEPPSMAVTRRSVAGSLWLTP